MGVESHFEGAEPLKIIQFEHNQTSIESPKETLCNSQDIFPYFIYKKQDNTLNQLLPISNTLTT